MASSNKATPIALIDISSGQIAAAHALVYTEAPQRTPHILAEQVLDIPLQEELTIDRFIADVEQYAEKAITQLQKSDLHRPEYILLTLAAPWVVSQTRQIQYKKNTPFVCTQKLIDELLQKEIAFVENHDMERFGSFGSDGMLIEKQLSSIVLNGYHTTHPIGKKALELEMALTVTISPKPVLDRFLQVIRRHYGTRQVGFASRLFSTYVFLRDFYHIHTDAWIIDLGNEITDVGFIKDGFMLYHHTFPIGSNNLYKTLTDKNQMTLAEAKARIETYRLGKSDPAKNSIIETAIQSFVESWLEEIHHVFDSGAFGYCAPDTCFILGDERFAQIIPTAIRNDVFVQHFCSNPAARPVFLTPNELATIIHDTDETYHATVSIDSLFATRIL